MHDPDSFPLEIPQPTAKRPLLGQSVLLVEDSVTSSEALRLMCTRSGARVRRADCLTSARRHLAVYLPSILLVDMVLPDGEGHELLADMSKQRARLPVMLGMSAHLGMEMIARAAGADGFIAKPIRSLDAFQMNLLAHMPDVARQIGPRRLPDLTIAPDPTALRQDTETAAELLRDAPDAQSMDYAVNFIAALARENQDGALSQAADALREHGVGHGHRNKLAGLLADRLKDQEPAL